MLADGRRHAANSRDHSVVTDRVGECAHVSGRRIVEFKYGLIGRDLWVGEDLVVAIDPRAPEAMRGEDGFPIRDSFIDHMACNKVVHRLPLTKLIFLRPFEELQTS